MFACIDAHYTDAGSRTGLVLFQNWSDEFATSEFVDEQLQEPADYVPGSFFLRELPCVLAAIKSFANDVQTIVIDGYVWLDQSGRKGFGAYLFEALDGSVSVIGVAKNRFIGSKGIDVLRGASQRPLFVTAAGIEMSEAARVIAAMHGPHRIPTLIKRADYISRHGLNC